MNYSIIIRRDGLISTEWQKVKNEIRIIGFEEKAAGIWERVYEDKNERDSAFFGTKIWLKKRGYNMDKLIIERFPEEEG